MTADTRTISARFRRRAAEPAPAADPEPARHGSILLLEVADGATRAALLDAVAGRHRFVAAGLAHATLALPVGDALPGIRSAVSDVEGMTHRRLLDSTGLVYPERPDGGLDVAVLTAGRPLRIALVASAGEPALGPVQTALDGCCAVIAGALPAARLAPRELAQPGAPLLDKLLGALATRPDVLLVVGLTARPAEAERAVDNLGRYLETALRCSEDLYPVVLFAGAAGLDRRLSEILGARADTRGVDLSAGGPAAVRRELRAIWQERLTEGGSGLGLAQSWVAGRVMPAGEAFAVALRFLAARRGHPVLGADVGGSSTTVVRATATGASVRTAPVGIGGSVQWALAGDQGRLLGSGDPERLRDELANRARRPWSLPETVEEWATRRALVRAAIHLTRQQAGDLTIGWHRQLGLAVARGDWLIRGVDAADDAWAIAAGLGATGTFELMLDRYSLLPGLGALAEHAPQAAAEALLADGLRLLATIAVGTGRGRPGEPAARVELKLTGGERREAAVRVGQTAALPLDPAESADLAIQPERGYDFGWGAGRLVQTRVRGSAAGVLAAVKESPRR